MIKCAPYTYKASTGKIFINSRKEKFPFIIVLNDEEFTEYTEVSVKEFKEYSKENSKE